MRTCTATFKLWSFLLIFMLFTLAYYSITVRYPIMVRKLKEHNLNTSSSFKESIDARELSTKTKGTEQTVLLLWYKPFGMKRKDQILNGCGGCLLTDDRNKLIGDGVKVVVMHYREFNISDLPRERSANHLYAWWAMESPITIRNSFDMNRLNGIFNLSITHRRNSDVWSPYASSTSSYLMINKGSKPKNVEELDALIKEKTHLALWVVSNCNINRGAIDRMRYATRMMQAGFNLTFGGKCSGSKVRREFNNTKFKFYLAFENSWGCKDYITEKFWQNSLASMTVPVVLGAPKADYEAVAPPNSFIYAQDFPTPEDLVKYLEYLNRNDEEYKKYLQWMTMDISKMPLYQQQTNFCGLCSFVKGLKRGIDDSLLPVNSTLSHHRFSPKSWFYGTENRACLWPSRW